MMNDRLRELIEEKSYDVLTAEEKEFVLSEMEEAYYREQHQLIAKARQNLKSEAGELKANESIRSNVLAAMRAKRMNQEEEEEKEKQSVGGFFAIKIPLWTALAAVLLIFLFTTPIVFDGSLGNKKNNTLLTATDTVYIDKIIRDTIRESIENESPKDSVIKTLHLNEDSDIDKGKNVDLIRQTLSNKNAKKENDKTQKQNIAVEKNDVLLKELEETMAIGGYKEQFDFRKTSTGKSLSSDPVARSVLGVGE